MAPGGILAAVAAALLLSPGARGQAGDRAGEEQPRLPADLAIPAALPLSPEDEARTFSLPPGLSIELVAAEPLVRDPVAFAFDHDGRLWVVEMSGYMPDVDGTNEREPSGAIAVLEDRDGDGRMDERTVFLDGLVLPRAVAPARGGALVIAPPRLYFCRDEDGDGRADLRQEVDSGLTGLESPEHAINALLPALDNAFVCANAPWDYVFQSGRWVRRPTSGKGQWGISQDDLGRLFFDDNSDPLRAALIPPRYAARNESHGPAAGANVRVATDPSMRPARITPGINRGYQEDMLVDFKLAKATATCAPWIHRGDLLPEEYRGDAFVCEPAGNLIARYDLAEDAAGKVRGTPVRRAGDLDFLTSTDERFRPVWLGDGPDGALYVADMYRGLIQHRLFVTSFLRQQVVERGLATPLHRGRIWRIAPAGAPRRPFPKLSEASWTQLAELLSHPSGWTRDTAQRLIVEEGELSADARELARAAARASPSALGRMHALWCLEGLDALPEDLAHAALGDPDRRVRLAAVRASERLAARGGEAVVARWVEVARGGDALLRWQVLFSLGEVPSEAGERAMLALLGEDASSPEARSAALSGLGQRELVFLERLLADEAWRVEASGRSELVLLLARALVREGRMERIERTLELAADSARPPWQTRSLLQGVLDGRPPDPLGKPGFVRLAREPAASARLAALADGDPEGELGAKAREVAACLAWPGKPGLKEVEVAPLSSAELARFERGRALYASTCAQCHLASGRGEIGRAPPLRSSPWVLESPERLARILIHGMRGPLALEGEEWNGDMPAVAIGDEDLAALMTYVRREWGNGASPVEPADVARFRAACAARREPWTAAELWCPDPEVR